MCILKFCIKEVSYAYLKIKQTYAHTLYSTVVYGFELVQSNDWNWYGIYVIKQELIEKELCNNLKIIFLWAEMKLNERNLENVLHIIDEVTKLMPHRHFCLHCFLLNSTIQQFSIDKIGLNRLLLFKFRIIQRISLKDSFSLWGLFFPFYGEVLLEVF